MNNETIAKAACEAFIMTVKDLYKYVDENSILYGFKPDTEEMFKQIKDLYDKRIAESYIYLEQNNKEYSEEFLSNVASLLYDIGIDTISIGKTLDALNMEIINKDNFH